MSLLFILAVAAVAMIIIEWLLPAWRRAADGAWLLRAASFNLLQAAVAFMGVKTWDTWFARASLVEGGAIDGAAGVALGYVLVTFVFYWWHRARHEVPVLWRFLHRVHHSPSRLEILATFYKHPVEMIINALMVSALLYLALGLEPAAVFSVVLLTGLAEFFYHWNVRTPHWVGWFLQRPEMHRVHHARGYHTCNFSDLPIWDALFGTLNNPREDIEHCGFPEEKRVLRLLVGRSVRET